MGLDFIKDFFWGGHSLHKKSRRRRSIPRTVLFFFLLFSFLVILFSPDPQHWKRNEDSSNPQLVTTDDWTYKLQREFQERKLWLERSKLSMVPGAAKLYESFGQAIVGLIPTSSEGDEGSELAVLNLQGVTVRCGRALTRASLRLGFVIIAFFPFWLLAAGSAFFYLNVNLKKGKGSSILAVCNRKQGPFYSGIWGPLYSNNSFSGTDFSCPGLACPQMERKEKATKHQLTQLLRKYQALNETNLALIQVILAHSAFPSYAPEEYSIPGDETESFADDGEISTEKQLVSHTFTGVAALLDAHHRAVKYVASLKERGHTGETLSKNYAVHLANLEKLTASASPLSTTLIGSLTPLKLWAFAQLNPQEVVCAYLATEAGKSLVFKHHGQGFTQISAFPHLQARAVLHSIPSYHHEYDGDQRLIIRQAVICHRRHGDFGRAFLPKQMRETSRVLRDLLEILASHPRRRQEIASLVELEAHLDELAATWTCGLTDFLKSTCTQHSCKSPEFLRGLIYKTVNLFPLQKLIEITLQDCEELRLKRISLLSQLTNKYLSRVYSLAKLPGFQEQVKEIEQLVEELDSTTKELLATINNSEAAEKWQVCRRMLFRHNWLSTRVGNERVASNGLVHCFLKENCSELPSQLIAFSGLVPLRQRRFTELFGSSWRNDLYGRINSLESIRIFTDYPQFLEEAKRDFAG